MELREKIARAIFNDDEQYDRMEHARAGLLSKADRIMAIPEIAEALDLAETWEDRLLNESEASRFDAEHGPNA